MFYAPKILYGTLQTVKVSEIKPLRRENSWSRKEIGTLLLTLIIRRLWEILLSNPAIPRVSI